MLAPQSNCCKRRKKLRDIEKLGGGGKVTLPVLKSTQAISIRSSWKDSWVVILKSRAPWSSLQSVCDWGTSGKNEKQPSVTLSIEGTGKWKQKTPTLPHFGRQQVNGGGWGWHLRSRLKWRLSGLPIRYFGIQNLIPMTDRGTDFREMETVKSKLQTHQPVGNREVIPWQNGSKTKQWLSAIMCLGWNFQFAISWPQ